jgi:hypothetical protein
MFSGEALADLRAAFSRRSSTRARRGRGAAVIVAGKPKAKNKDTGRAIHFRTGPERFNAGSQVGEAPRGGKGKGKTTRSQRTNKVYKQYLSGRPTVDDVERASRGDRTKAMGVVEREAPYRLTRDEREAWDRAKRRGGDNGKGYGGGGVLEMRSTQRDPLAPHRHPLVNTHRLYCDAKQALFVLVEQDNEGRDEIVCDLSTLRLERDAECRARLVALAATIGPGIVVDDECGDEEPIESQARYVAAMERDRLDGLSGLSGSDPSTMTDPPSDSDSNGDASSPAAAAPSDETLATARDAVDALGEEIRALKDGGAQNSDPEVARRVANLLELKAELRALEDAAEASTPDAIEAAIRDEREARERAVEEARRSLAESPIYALPERYLRFKCPDRPTAKALAKALAQEDLLALALEPA